MFQSLDEIRNTYNIKFTNDECKHSEIIINVFNNKVYYVSDISDPVLLNFMGKYYQNIKKNYQTMIVFYLSAIHKGYRESMYRLGHYYRYTVPPTDFTTMLMKKYFILASEKGCATSMEELGHFYKHVKNDYELMKKYYSMAADNGNTQAMYKLGNHYLETEQPPNYVLMKKYYLMAIDNGHTQAMVQMGKYYKYVEQPPNYELMEKYYLMAIDNGIIEAMLELSSYYHSINNIELKKKYLLMASDKGSPWAMHVLGLTYRNEQKYDLMVKYFHMAIYLEYPDAMYSLAIYYYYLNVKNEELMMKYLKMAAAKGHIKSIVFIINYHKHIIKSTDTELINIYYLMGINIVKQNLKMASNDDCIICYDKKDLYENQCKNHSMCIDCYFQIVYLDNDKKCPYCRQ